jgi:trk system potassium uptake protein TrkH
MFLRKIIESGFYSKIAFFISFLAIVGMITELGYFLNDATIKVIQILYAVVFLTGMVTLGLYMFDNRIRARNKVFYIDLFIFSYITILFLGSIGLYSISSVLGSYNWLYVGLIFQFIRDFSNFKINIKRSAINPAQLFVLSFIVIILMGAFFLMLPKATTDGNISFMNALFTSTSAVCVTGLAVVDTGTYFTDFGLVIIGVLIQIGGLGIMTFASYLSYFFTGTTSFENQLAMSDINNVDRLGEVFRTLKQVLLITAIIEFIGAVMIYFTINVQLIPKMGDRIFFAGFHSVSAFCNAGFSSLKNSLWETGWNYNYNLHLIIAFLILFGGLGFPILVNILQYIKYNVINRLFKVWKQEKHIHLPWMVNLNSRIVIFVTVGLTIFGSLGYFIFEYNTTLKDHGLYGKIVTSFFGSVTPRTAGYNTVDMSMLTVPTILITIFLMWVGASPGSTGGGIKTSTFAVATLNILSLVRGKTRIEVNRREISDLTVRRAFAAIALSLLIIGFGVLAITYFEPKLDLTKVTFECFSAFSTVGLSLGITGNLLSESKMVLILLMFIGRVSMLTLLIAFIRKEKYKNYRYPSEDVIVG